MLALINPDEKIYDKDNNILGSRVCYFYDEQIVQSDPLFFVDTQYSFDDADPQFFYYDETDQSVKYIPEEHLPIELTTPEPSEGPIITTEELVQRLLEQKLREYGITINQASANTP